MGPFRIFLHLDFSPCELAVELYCTRWTVLLSISLQAGQHAFSCAPPTDEYFWTSFSCEALWVLLSVPVSQSNSSPDASACTVCQTRTDSTRKLLRYSAGVRQSSEKCSNVTVRVSSYPRTRPALSALPHSAHSPALGLGLALARSCSHVPQCSPWLLGVPHLSEGLAFSWK